MTHQKHDIFGQSLVHEDGRAPLYGLFGHWLHSVPCWVSTLVDDAERDKSRGFFAYAEFEDPQAALAAIRNMNDYELNGRRLRVDLAMRPIWKR
jgi:RNA recognition motif. (a.k.a. RRM, RBD, or RNP domain)